MRDGTFAAAMRRMVETHRVAGTGFVPRAGSERPRMGYTGSRFLSVRSDVRRFEGKVLVTGSTPRFRLTMTVLALVAASTACSQVKSLATGDCTGDKPFVLVMVDGSSTQNDPKLIAEQVDVVTAVARRTSDDCGRLRVERFRGSASDVDTILDRDVTPDGATASNRDRNRDDLLAEVRQTLEKGLAASPAQGGSDPVGAMGRGARLLGQEERDHRQLIMVTDGVQSSSPNLATEDLTVATASSFVDQAGTLPDLTGIDLVVTGVGRVTGAQPPSSYINGLVAFYEEVCSRSGAASCQVVDALLLPGGSGS
jgi:hypothetical protein